VVFPVAPLAFHALGRDCPHGVIEIDFVPAGTEQFLRPREAEQEQPKPMDGHGIAVTWVVQERLP